MPEVAWVLRNARIEDTTPLLDIAIEGERIQALAPSLSLTGRDEWDLKGAVVLPGLVDAHLHLDRTLLEGRNRSGTLQEAIQIWQGEKSFLTYESYLTRAWRALRAAISEGTVALRTHVDIDGPGNLTALEALLELREQSRELVDLQVVALGYPGGDRGKQRALHTALEMGADAVGGTPALASDPRHSIDAALNLAESFGRPLDLHIDEVDDPGSLTLEYLAERTIEHGLQGLVTAGHCCALALVDDATADRVMTKVFEARINVVTLPSNDLVLMGRGRTPAPRGITRVRELLGHGVNVVAASGSVRDPFDPFGRYDPLSIANLTAHLAHLSGTQALRTALEMVTSRAAEVLGLHDYGLHEGAAADLVVLKSRQASEIVTAVPERLATFKRGELVVRAERHRSWAGEKSSWV